jgi:hypothetical protein
MDTRTIAPYYSGGTLMYLPNTDGALALRYVDSRNPDVIVISDFSDHRTYLKDWIQGGIPRPNADLVYKTGSSVNKDRVAIYR